VEEYTPVLASTIANETRLVRTMLYLACVVGIRFNPIIRSFYQLLVSLNAMVKTQTQWHPRLSPSS
jgi:hypothetical protein